MMSGLFLSQSIQMSKIASKIPGEAVQLSLIQRLRRFLDNPSVHVRSWYAPLARELLTQAAQSVGEIRLIIDATKCGFHYQWLTVSLAFHHRAIPIAWTWLEGSRGHSSATTQLALLSYVQGLLPTGRPVLLLGDTEFEDGDLQKQCFSWQWHYVLRQKPSNRVHVQGKWHSFRSLVGRPGTSRWVERALLTEKHQLMTNLLAYWRQGEEAPWLLSTNLSTQPLTMKAYERRMWIEEMHGDLKRHGFHLEDSHLGSFSRLSRLTLAVVLVYLWLILEGAKVIKQGHRRLVDRNDRRDLSIFQIGLRSMERLLLNDRSFVFLSFLPPTTKLSGG
jgi:Transposase DDE domain